ncbi:MAG: sulfatase-like hydrolase/transferase [Planctomycetota bacterium]
MPQPLISCRLLGQALMLLIATVCSLPSHADEPATQPNMLWIITDDQRYDSIAAFNRILSNQDDSPLGPVSSPHVDRLVAQGTTFINTYTQSPACAPSRAAMHSGRYPHRRGVYGFETHHANNADIYRHTVPETLAKAGYQTAHTGKLGERTLPWDGQRVSWDSQQYQQIIGGDRKFRLAGDTDWVKEPLWVDGNNLGENIIFFFDDGERVLINNVKSGDHPAESYEAFADLVERLDILPHYPPGKEPAKSFDKMIIGGESSRSVGQTRDGFTVRNLESYLQHPGQSYQAVTGKKLQGPDPSKPLFVHVGFDFPHTPVLPPKSYRDRFAQYTYKIPQAAPGEIAALPPQLQKLYDSKRTDHLTEEHLQQMIQDYYAFCAYGDQLVGEAVEAFTAYSEAQGQPWMIVYVCGDHGWKLNEHGMTSKFATWDLDVHNPVVVVSSDKKNFPAGKVVHDFTEFVDMAPTFYAAAGLDVESPEFDHLDGYDLAKVADGSIPARDYVLIESWWVTGPRAALRTKDYAFSMKVKPAFAPGKQMDWPLGKSLKQVEAVLYDLSADPDEVKNVALDPRYAEVATALRNKLEDIVIREPRRIEVDWKAGPEGKVFRLDAGPQLYGGDDKKLELPNVSQ